MVKKRTQTLNLNVYLNTTLVGMLTKKNTGALEFQYDKNWINRDNSFPISQSLPLIQTAYKGPDVFFFFENLLPDNPEIKTKMATKLKAESSETFDLLTIAGQDCVGAFQFTTSEAPPPTISEVKGKKLSDREIENLLGNLSFNPLGNDLENEFRISIAGAQEKTALLKFQDTWLLPRGSTPTSHIFKPPLGKFPNGIDMSTSVENEWLCAKICKELGLSVASSEIAAFGNQKCLVVERFDRLWSEDKTILKRIPQEDLCQALGISSSKKYESDGGPGIVNIMEFLNASDNSFEDKKMFLTSQIAFFILAGIDGHGKNFSIFQTETGFSLTPLYDILSAYPAIDKKQIQKEKAKLAMRVGKSGHYKISKIFRRHWLETARLSGFSEKEMEKIIDTVRDKAANIIENGITLPQNFPTQVYDSIIQGMEKSLFKLS